MISKGTEGKTQCPDSAAIRQCSKQTGQDGNTQEGRKHSNLQVRGLCSVELMLVLKKTADGELGMM